MKTNKHESKKNKIKEFLFFAIIFSFVIPLQVSCSLKYSDSKAAQEKIPEFTFTNVVYSSYENNKKTMELKSARLEQFNFTGFSYAQNANFIKWNEKGEIEMKGNCEYLSMDTKNKIYNLYNQILLESIPNALLIQAENLKWNQQNEQLTSDETSTVLIQKDNVSLTGQGFSASGVSRSFIFNSKVIGSMTEEENK